MAVRNTLATMYGMWLWKEWTRSCKKVSDWFDKLYRIFLLLFPSYRFTYIRFDDGNVQVKENSEDKSSDDSEDFDEDEMDNDASFQDRYCVFCTKLDAHRKKAIHNLKCTCHDSPAIFSFSPTSSSFSPLLVMYH